MGTRPVLFAVGTACLCGAGNRSKQHPRKTGPPIMPVYTDSCKRLIGRVFTAARPNLNGTGASPGVTPGRARETTEGADGRPLCARRGAAGAGQPTNGRLYLCRGGLGSRPTVGSTSAGSGQARWPVTSSSARSSSPSAGLQGADGTRSRCLRPDHLRSGWPSRDPVPDGSFHGHGSGC